MTKKPKYEAKNRFADSKLAEAEDEFVLADVDVNLDDADIAPVPIDNFLEDDDINDDAIIDSLLVDNQTHHFDEEKHSLSAEKVIEDISLNDDFKNSAKFNIEPVDDVDSNEEPIIYDSQEVHFETPKSKGDSQAIGNAAALNLIKETLLADKVFISSVSEKTQPVKPYIPPVQKASKGHWINTLLLGILGVIVLGLLGKVFQLTGDVSKLQSLTSILEEDVTLLQEKKTVNNPMPNPSLVEPTQPNNQIQAHNLPNQTQNLPQTQDLKQVTQISSLPIEDKMVMISVPEKKRLESRDKLNIPPEKQKHNKPTHKVLNQKSKPNTVTNLKKNVTKAAPKKESILTPWSVNILTFKNETEAKNRTAKLISQGIPVKISPFHASNGKWYQLKVNGFKNKDTAQSYANKLRKSTKLSSISVVVN